jgi:hypothetical protein
MPHISNASVVVAFQQGVRDEKMLENLATHDVQNVSELFSLADKCTTVTPTFYKNKIFVQIGVHIKMHIKLLYL